MLEMKSLKWTTIMLVLAMGCSSNARMLHLEFYLQGGGPNTTSSLVTGSSVGQFGAMYVYDNIITQDPSDSSSVLGRAQGIAVVADAKSRSAFYSFTVMYESSQLNGRLALLGMDYRAGSSQLVIAGGTGDFKLASGYATFTYLTFASLFTARLSVTIYQPES